MESSDKEKSENSIATRRIILGKPISGKAFFNCEVVKLFSDLGFGSLMLICLRHVIPLLCVSFI